MAIRPLPSNVKAEGPWNTMFATKPHRSALFGTLTQGLRSVNGNRQKNFNEINHLEAFCDEMQPKKVVQKQALEVLIESER
jgi:hypothetical protein